MEIIVKCAKCNCDVKAIEDEYCDEGVLCEDCLKKHLEAEVIGDCCCCGFQIMSNDSYYYIDNEVICEECAEEEHLV